MRINGLKYLNRNDYSSITISSDNIRVTGKDYSTIKLSDSFSDRLKGLSDVSKMSEVIDYFLRYNRISLVTDYYYSRSSKYVAVGSTSWKLLKLRVIPNDDSKKKIFSKYIKDRKDFLETVDVDTYILDSDNSTTSYDYTDNGCARFVLAKKDLKYPDFEVRFLDELLDYVFDGKEIHIRTLYNRHNLDGEQIEVLDGTYIISEESNSCRIRLYDNNNVIKMAVIRHNEMVKKEKEERENAKIMQIKLEGF